MLHAKDTSNHLRHMTMSKLYNLLQLRFSFLLMKYFKIFIRPAHPISLSIEPTTACNLSCPECPSGLKSFSRPTGKLTMETNKKIIDELYKKLHFINFYFQGEPFIHPDFLQFVRHAKKKGVYTSTSTNAHFIDKAKADDIVLSGLDRLIISIDGTSQETYEQYRISGKLEKVINATKFILSSKKEYKSNTPHVIFQFLAVKPNEHEIPKVFALGKELGVDEVNIKTAQLYDYRDGNPLMPENSKYSRYVKTRSGKYKLKGNQGNHCWRMWSGSVLTWDGKVLPCCFDKDASFSLGEISEVNFKTIWRNKRYDQFRRSIFYNRSNIEICKNCSEGTKVWAS